jgi:DNA polymerase
MNLYNFIVEKCDKNKLFTILNEKIKQCNKCSFVHKRIKTLGRGCLDAPILLIGESPWFKDRWNFMTEEEINNEMKKRYGNITSFGDKAGEILSKILKEVGLNEDKDIFVTNIVRCSLPNNIKPNSKIVHNCIFYLLQEISIIKPKIILAASAAAREFFEADINECKVKGKTVIFGIYHPGIVIHSPDMLSLCIEQFVKIKNFIEKGA